MLTLSLIPPCSVVRYFANVCVCVCEWTKRKHRGGRGSSGGEKKREQWCVQHLNCLFISSHCINYTDTAYKWVYSVLVCMCRGVGEGEKGMEGRGTIRSDRCGNFWCCGVHFPASRESQKRTRGAVEGIVFCSGGRDAEETVLWLRNVWQSGIFMHVTGVRMGVSEARGYPERSGAWSSAPAPPTPVCMGLQWLVEHSGQNLSDSAEAVNHFGPPLCNLSPTSRHITAARRGLLLHIFHVPDRLAFPYFPGLASARFISIRETLANHMHDKAFCLGAREGGIYGIDVEYSHLVLRGWKVKK